jgi:hypothetical protein
VVTTVLDVIARFLTTVASNLGRIVTAGASILVSLLKGIANNIQNVTNAATDVIVAFIRGVGNMGPRIITAAVQAITKFINSISKGAVKLANEGAKAILNFLNGVAAAIETYAPQFRSAGIRIGIAIADGVTFGLASKAADVAKKAWDLGKGALGALGRAVGAHSPSVEAEYIGQMIVQGLANGMAQPQEAVAAANAMGNGVINAVKTTFQITSPSKVMYELGKFVGQGFAQGLRGSGDDIKSAFADMNSKLTDAMRTARETIATEQAKLNKLREANKPDAEAIKEAQKVIEENQAILARTTAGHNALIKTLKDEKGELLGLSKDYVVITDKLKLAEDALAQAMQTRDQAVKDFTSKYSTLPEIVTEDAEGNAIDQLAAYEEALKHQADAVGAYQSTLEQLRKLGLDDATYQKLVDEGTQDQAFANQLLAGGRTAVESLNVLDANLKKVSETLATNAGKNLYQAGVDAAQGLVNGLKSKKSAIRETMEDIAREILTTLKKELKIKSPSEEFAEIGAYSMEGLAKGFQDSSGLLTNAVDDAAKDALTAMQESMQGISGIVENELNANPVITPVLDLTQVRTQSQELAALTRVTPITAATSYGQASMISTQQTAQAEEAVVVPGTTSVKFEQNNYSPEALSEVEIYRQTKNQLSQLKSALALN